LLGVNVTKLSLIIRPVELKDATDINVIRRMPGVFENLMATPSETVRSNEDFIGRQADDDHLFCAEITKDGKPMVVGMAGVHIKKLLRQRHVAELGIMVHKDYWGQGIGRQLIEALMDLADNWLMLKRLELTVYPENLAAIKLYEKFGFVREGVMKFAGIRHGAYADIVMMARYHGTTSI
jgi:L-phenylalanine/L-methionine N-acetyltransferase